MLSNCVRSKRATSLVGWALLSLALLFSSNASAQRLSDEAFNEAVENLSAEDPDARIAAIDLLSRRAWRHRRELAPHFRRLLRNDPDWRVRASSGRAVGRLSLRGAVPDLVRALRDPQVEVRVVAAAALWRLPDPAAVPALLELLSDDDSAARQWGALALGVIRDTRATIALTRLLDDPADPVRLDTIRSLGRIGDPRALDALTAFVADEDNVTEERLEAVNSIASLQGPAKVNALVRLAAIDEDVVRLQIVRALGQVGDALVLPVLRRLLESESDDQIDEAINESIRMVQERASQGGDGEGESD